jgi:hypothetical protein
MIDKTSEEERVNEMIEATMKVARGDYSIQVRLSERNDELDSLAMGLNMMIDDLRANTIEIGYASDRVDQLLSIIQRVARGNHTVACKLSTENDMFDALGIGVNMMIDDVRTSTEERERLIQGLQETLAKVNTLSGLLPICAWCKKLRDDKGYWKSVEEYISAHTGAEFTHGMCPECQNKYFAEHFTEEYSKENNNSKVS